jgi:hypothetical protein
LRLSPETLLGNGNAGDIGILGQPLQFYNLHGAAVVELKGASGA